MDKLSQVNTSQFFDLNSLDKLRANAQQDDKAALKEVAQQFEGIFVQMLMKSMRDANAVFESDSPMNTEYTKFYEQMHDQQMSLDLSSKGMLGLADLMVQQLSPETSDMTPASVMRMQQGQIDSSSLNHQAQRVESVVEQIISGKVEPQQAATQEIKQAEFANREDFVTRLYPMAKAAADKLGTTPEVLLAQAALETGWGQKMVRQYNGEQSFNLFNIKADNRWQGHKAAVNTLEFEQGIAVKQRADFRVYDSFEQSFNDFVGFLKQNGRYQEALQMAAKPEAFINGLQQAGYATDPKYAQKVISVMSTINREFGNLLTRGN